MGSREWERSGPGFVLDTPSKGRGFIWTHPLVTRMGSREWERSGPGFVLDTPSKGRGFMWTRPLARVGAPRMGNRDWMRNGKEMGAWPGVGHTHKGRGLDWTHPWNPTMENGRGCGRGLVLDTPTNRGWLHGGTGQVGVASHGHTHWREESRW